MKNTLLVGGLAALTLAATAGAAAAFAPQVPDRAAGAMRADVDGDGRLSRAEFVAQRTQRLVAADANRDGTVTPEEMHAAVQVHRAARADARFERLDGNDDGAISRAEFDAAREARPDRPRAARAHRAAGRMGQRPARAARMESRGPVVIADARARAEQAFARLDADSDGFITVAERQAGRQAMREQRRERMAERRAERQASPQAPASE